MTTKTTPTETGANTPPALLRAAARQILAAASQLNANSIKCDACGQRHFAQLVQARYRERLMETHGKLLRAADELDRALTTQETPSHV